MNAKTWMHLICLCILLNANACSEYSGYAAEIKGSTQICEPGKTCKSLKILGIGNSFTLDASEYLYDILTDKAMGYDDVVVASIYSSGKSINWHARNMACEFEKTPGNSCNTKEKSNIYPIDLYINDRNSSIQVTKNATYREILERENWDIVILQTYPSGVMDLYNEDILYVVDQVNAHTTKKPNYYWAMTWAFQQGSMRPHLSFHGYDQLKMYQAATLAVQDKILPHKTGFHVIPTGTAIQNLRYGIIGDNLNRDGYHLSYHTGRFAAALMTAMELTGKSIAQVTFRPQLKDPMFSLTDRQVDAIK